MQQLASPVDTNDGGKHGFLATIDNEDSREGWLLQEDGDLLHALHVRQMRGTIARRTLARGFDSILRGISESGLAQEAAHDLGY